MIDKGTELDSGSIRVLIENRRAFVAFLERRLGDRALAEDVLQDAFSKLLERADTVPADEKVIPWFYRTLRNAAIDRFRRREVANRAFEQFAREVETITPSPEIERELCTCVSGVATTLKPEYAHALKAIEIDGMSVKEFAEREGLSASNAGVRVFRARDALRRRVMESCGVCAEHGCVDCTCRKARVASSPSSST